MSERGSEVVTVKPLRKYKGPKKFKLNETISGVLIARSAFPVGTDLNGIPNELHSQAYYIEGNLTPDTEKFNIHAIRSSKIVTATAPFGMTQRYSQQEFANYEIYYSHARADGGLRVAFRIPNSPHIAICDLIPPDSPGYNYQYPRLGR